MVQVLKELRTQIHGLIHCSGGAQTKVLHFIDNLHVIKDNLFDVPPLFQLIYEQSATTWQEMYKVFNMGHRLEIYLPEKESAKVIRISKSFGVDAKIIGHVEPFTGRQVTVKGREGEFIYS
jgi:phosphoribosylformylglycinamidine cyclo-ligase